MDGLIERIGDELEEAAALRNFQLLLHILSNIAEHPNEAKFRSLLRSKLREKLADVSFHLLQEIGFTEDGGALILPSGAALENLRSAKEVLECLAMSMGDTSLAPISVDDSVYTISDKPAHQSPAEPADEDDDLAAAMKLSMEGQEPSSEQRDREMAAALDREENPVIKDISFQRFNHEDRIIEEDAVEKINEFCRASSERYVDPQFPPTDKSLYMNEEDAKTWGCIVCGNRTPLPPVPPVPKSKEEAEAAEALWQTLNKCSSCGNPAHHVVNVRYFQRPTQWLRPATRCDGCELMYSHLPAGKELASKMCCHFLRDHMTNTTIGAPWKLIRSEARCEDVCQGGLGNCWFAGALSTVAQRPELIDNMFVTKDFNPHGAYHLRLFHAGEWRGILVDDLFPTTRVFEGYMDATHAHYSRGGDLCYLQGARRQIWVPLVEKAAAKLHGCWGALESGTIREAMALFTGFPTQQIQGLYIRKAVRQRLQEKRQARIEERTRMLMQGIDVPEDEVDSDEDIDNDAITWSKIMSFNEAGYLMGMGCSEDGCEKTKAHLVEEMGLAAPHAYGVMDAREVEVNGKLQRFMKIRNPWGERAPRTWKGDWGKDSKLWTFDLQLKLGVVNRSGVKMDDENSIFWMTFEDVKEYFSAVEVCRIHSDWHEVRQRCWLPSGVGPGEAFDLTVFRRTQVDIVAWQEKNIRRESAMGARSANVDVGLAVLRQRGIASDGEPEYELIEYIQRTTDDDCSAEMILEGGFVYRLVPISFGLMQEMAPRRCVIAVHSVQKVELQKVPSSWRDVACGAFEGCRKIGKRKPVPTMNGPAPGIFSYVKFEQGCGCGYAVENTTDTMTAIQFDADGCLGCNFTRESSMVVAAVPPRSRQLIMGITPKLRGAGEISIGFSAVSLGAEAAGFAMLGDDLHLSLPLLSPHIRNAGNRPVPDEAILKRAPPAEDETPSAKRGKSSNNQTDEELLAEAMRLSMGPQPTSTTTNDRMYVDDDEDELAAAMKLSMQQPAPAQAAPAPRPPAADAKAQLSMKVKELFEEYRRNGMAPNEAATRALAEAQKQVAMTAAA